MAKARQTCAGKVPPQFAWAFTAYGYKFLCSHPYRPNSEATGPATAEDSLFSQSLQRCNPLATVDRDYREHLIEKGLQCICGAGTGGSRPGIGQSDSKLLQLDDTLPDGVASSQISDVLCYTNMLNGCE